MCWPEDAWNNRFKFGLVNRGLLPELEENGVLSDLDLTDKQGLAETSHYVFFDNGIVGELYNHNGPKVGRVQEYIREQMGPLRRQYGFPKIVPLMSRDAWDRINRFNFIEEVTVKVVPLEQPTLTGTQVRLGQAILAAFDAANNEAGQVTVCFGKKPYARKPTFIGGLVEDIRQWARGSTDLGGEVTGIKIGGRAVEEQATVEVNLFKHHLVAKKKVVRQRGRKKAVEDLSAYQAIEEAFEDMHEDIRNSLAVLL